MDFFDTGPLSQWLSANPEWILVCIAVTAFIESLAIAGIIVPGVLFLLAIATVAGVAEVSMSLCLAAGAIGAISGDVLSFFIGYHFKEKILQTWPVNKYPDAVQKGEAFFLKYGIYSVVIGRFVGPIRPVLPLVAGIMNMPPLKFVSVNILSALAWSPVYILPGYLAGSAV